MNKPLRILILDNNREEKSFGSHDLVHWALKTAPAGSEIQVRRAPEHDLPREDLQFDALLLSGSITSCMEYNEPWVKPYDDYVIAQINVGKPILGVCYGHQTLARCLFRMSGMEPKLGFSTDAELGWQKIQKIADSKIFETLPPEFMTYESHYEEVTELPPGTRRLAETPRCAIQAFEVEGKPVYGIQFHPEYSVKDAEASMAAKLKKGVRKDWILNIGKGPKLYDETVGNIIFGNFFKIADQHRND
jgi:GMP synthase-like glutamine amidotransferase